MATEPPAKKKCLGVECENDAGTLQCPTCLKLGNKDSFFCSQDCFKKSWVRSIPAAKPPKPTCNPLTHTQLSSRAPTSPCTNLKVISSTTWSPRKQSHQIQQPVTTTPSRASPSPAPCAPSTRSPSTAPCHGRSPTPSGPKMATPSTAAPSAAAPKFEILDAKGIEAMRKVSKLAREVLDLAAAAAVPGVTTDYIDEIVHKACVERKSYPSPLNYNHFPKSCCTSVNEVICHGIPDKRILLDGDILNIDVTLYHEGYHADLNETYYIGDRSKADPDNAVKPGVQIREFGNIIEKHAKIKDCSVIRTYCGHGIGKLFHCPPNVPHYAKNKTPGECKAGMTFTIEPMIALGKYRDITWPDNWTSTTIDGKRTAQFEHTLLVTEDGVEVLTARNENSPGGAIPMPTAA
ncbi:hypothetical protein NLG97_g7454 [Lecanicillium saksenae]|uniref:Uncharacterized protein n=1 Tax=Lecanicillium saksenae TaxID=468837 RepID=A0ACC1QNC0_9HYPO|nr:hypothetical protein NLG97_g7454 [Lecanicillium saksenae]